jgi:uncharacterized protein YndB with AHSA1/START domain
MNDELGEISVCYSVKYVRRSRHPVARLWRAITDSNEVSAWMGYPTSIDLRPGGVFAMDFRKTDGSVMDCVIFRVEPEEVLAYAWERSVCEWTVEPDGEGSRYTFIQNGLPDRGDGEEELVAGWQGFFDQLDEYLDGVPLDVQKHEATWERRKEPYRDLLAAAFPGRRGNGG